MRSRSATTERVWARIDSADRSWLRRPGRSRRRPQERGWAADGIRSASSSAATASSAPRRAPRRGPSSRGAPAPVGGRRPPTRRTRTRVFRSARSRGSTISAIRRSELAVPQPERRRRDHREALVGGVLQLANEYVGGAGVREQPQRAAPRRRRSSPRRRVQQLRDLAHHPGGLLAGPAQRRARDHRRGGQQGDPAADQRVRPPGQRRLRVGQQRRPPRSTAPRPGSRSSRPRPAGTRPTSRPRRPGSAARSRAEHQHEQVGDEDPDRDAEGDLGDPAQPLAVRRAQAEHGRDRREERRVVAEHVRGDQPGDAGRDRGLGDVPAVLAGAGPPAARPRCGRRCRARSSGWVAATVQDATGRARASVRLTPARGGGARTRRPSAAPTRRR